MMKNSTQYLITKSSLKLCVAVVGQILYSYKENVAHVLWIYLIAALVNVSKWFNFTLTHKKGIMSINK